MVVAGIFILWLALFLGLNLPDLDQQTTWLVHRSLLTHGLIAPVGVFLAVYRERTALPRFFSMGFSLATATHLAFDLFPKAWVGFALIHIPFWGRSSALFSWLWLGLSLIGCLYLTFVLLRTLLDMGLALLSLGLAFTFYASGEAQVWPALLALLLAVGLTLALPANCRHMFKTFRSRP
jgi:hypothetical protein